MRIGLVSKITVFLIALVLKSYSTVVLSPRVSLGDASKLIALTVSNFSLAIALQNCRSISKTMREVALEAPDEAPGYLNVPSKSSAVGPIA